MYSFCIRYGIAVVFILTLQFIFACVADVAYEGTVPITVVTSFLKAPWINLNNSLADEVASECRNDVTMVFQNADAGQMWALQMLDASSGIPSGILMGNTIDLGMYDECIAVNGHDNPANIQGQHCMVSLSIPSKFVKNASAMLLSQKFSVYNPSADVNPGLSLSVCLPSSCGVQDVVGFVNASIRSTPELAKFEVSIVQVKCSGAESAADLTIGTILTILFFMVIVGVLLFCTVCDLVVRLRSENTSSTMEKLAKFSLYTNAIKLLSTETTPGTMPAINGIRFLSMSLLVLSHRMIATLLNPLVNLSDIFEIRQTKLSLFMLILPYVVDTFFLLSGFLATHSYLKKLRTGVKYNVLEFYLHRYIRLAPSMCVSLLVIIFITPHLGSGPIWQTLVGDQIDYCRKNWWANLLFIQNFSHREEMCAFHTWYIAIEMQFFLLSPIILYPLFHRPKLGLTMLGVISIAAFIAPAVQIIVNDYSFLVSTTKIRTESIIDFYNTYTITYNRALPYLIGIFLGYDVVNNERRVTKVQVAFNWILACVLILFCFWNANFIQPITAVHDVVWEAVYVSFGRLGWSLAMAWILYACTHDYGGQITRLLSQPIFAPLSRMSYNIYMVHVLLQIVVSAIKRTSEYYTKFNVFHLVWGDLAVSIIAAFILNICIETPALMLEEIVRAKRPATIVNRASMKKTEELSAIIGEYLDLTRDQVGSNLVIEMRMQQLDFWRSISDVLNTLTKRPKKNPAEWAKTWQEWRKDTQNGTAQLQTRLPTLEQELLIFLIAVSYGLDNAARFKKSDIMESARSRQLSSCDLQNKDIVQSLISESTPFSKKMT